MQEVFLKNTTEVFFRCVKNSSLCMAHKLLKNPINDENEAGMADLILQSRGSQTGFCEEFHEWSSKMHNGGRMEFPDTFRFCLQQNAV